MSSFLQWLIPAIVWSFANVLYLDLRRRGRRGGRFIAFFAGYPGTLISLFLVREGTVAEMQPPPDDEDRLLREIRVDRERRTDRERWALGGGADGEAPPMN